LLRLHLVFIRGGKKKKKKKKKQQQHASKENGIPLTLTVTLTGDTAARNEIYLTMSYASLSKRIRIRVRT